VCRFGYLNVNVCSSSCNEFKNLSPMLLGPIQFDSTDSAGQRRTYTARNIENMWQFAKVWTDDLAADGTIKAKWFVFRDAGWADTKAHRWPRGRAVKDGPLKNVPEFVFWNGQRYSYGEARKLVYIRYYVQLAEAAPAYAQLHRLVHEEGTNLQILGYDGRDFTTEGLTLRQCLEDESRPFGHELVLTAMLRNERVWE
jgi:hypothetical protein